MRTGERSGEVFDALLRRGEIVVHHSEVERLAALTTALTTAEELIVADTRDQVGAINAAIRDHRLTTGHTTAVGSVTTAAGERLGIGDRIATRRNNRDLGVANRDCWTVTGIDDDGTLQVHGRAGQARPARDLRPRARRTRLRHHRPRRPRRDRPHRSPARR